MFSVQKMVLELAILKEMHLAGLSVRQWGSWMDEVLEYIPAVSKASKLAVSREFELVI